MTRPAPQRYEVPAERAYSATDRAGRQAPARTGPTLAERAESVRRDAERARHLARFSADVRRGVAKPPTTSTEETHR